jgi:HAD superfamily hydrolase (TIGR01509 family)
MLSPAFEAIIFDLDGTLIDTETADLRACQILYQEYGISITPEYWANHIVGHKDSVELVVADLMQRNGHTLNRAVLHQRFRELWSGKLDEITPMPGVIQLLPALQAQGYRLGVATASDRPWTYRWLNHFNLWPYFQIVATCDDVTHNKPAPDVYYFVAAQLHVAPERCLVFEDSLPGSNAAKAAGMTVVAVRHHTTQTLSFSRADRVINSLTEINVDWVNSFYLQR